MQSNEVNYNHLSAESDSTRLSSRIPPGNTVPMVGGTWYLMVVRWKAYEESSVQNPLFHQSAWYLMVVKEKACSCRVWVLVCPYHLASNQLTDQKGNKLVMNSSTAPAMVAYWCQNYVVVNYMFA